MAAMFLNCSSLKELNLKNYYTSFVLNFHGIFKYCYSLLSINIINFDTSSANMNDILYGCHLIISLNISHFIKINIFFIINVISNKTIDKPFF